MIEKEVDLRKAKAQRKAAQKKLEAERKRKALEEKKKREEEERKRKIEEMKEKYSKIVKEYIAAWKKPEKALPKLEDFQVINVDEEEKKEEVSDEKPIKMEEQVELLKTCDNSKLATPVNEEAKEENYYDEEFEEDVLEFFQQHPPQNDKIKCINCHQFKEFNQIIFFKRPHKHSFCRICMRNNYYWFDNKKDDQKVRCLYYACRKDVLFKDFCKEIPTEDLNYVFGRRLLDYIEHDLQKEYTNCPKCNLFFVPEEG